jgi:pimeloyl-ACP methyl ester carboxylesterase
VSDPETNPWPIPNIVRVGRAELAVYDHGEPAGSIGTAVLLHGMADVARSLAPQVDALADRYRVVSFDARGHGRSSHPGAYSGLHFVADLAGVIDELDIADPVLIGHSLGGHSVANYSGLFPDGVRAVVLIEGMGPPVDFDDGSTAARLQRGRDLVGMLRSAPTHRVLGSVEEAAERLCSVHERLEPARAMILAAEGTRPVPEGGVIWRHDPAAWEWTASIDHLTTEERWGAITVPVLAVSGREAWDSWWNRPRGPVRDRERLTPEQFDARLARFNDIEHIDLDDAGHMIHFDQPARLNELIDDFLRARVEDRR